MIITYFFFAYDAVKTRLSILVNPEIIPILSGFHSSIIRTRKRPALVLISDTKLLCKNDYKTISAA